MKKALLYRIVEDSNLKLLKEYINFVNRNKITPKHIKPSLIYSIKQILTSFCISREIPVPSNDDRENKMGILENKNRCTILRLLRLWPYG